MRNKKQEPIIHRPSTLEIFYCLSDCIHWLKLLLERNKVYSDFLHKLCEREFYKKQESGVTIKQVAQDCNIKPDKVSKWLNQIYDDIFELNETEPELFKSEGVRHDLYFKCFDARASFTLWLPRTPREFEYLHLHFIKARMGTDTFWVKDVHHHIENGEYRLTIWLDGNDRNKYRELLIDRGLYYGVLHFMDVYRESRLEIDKTLKEWYRE